MRRFRFPLERVLRQRALQEATAEHAVATALADAHGAARELARAREAMTQSADTLCGALADRLSGSTVALHAQYAAALKARVATLRERRDATAAHVQETRTALRERRRAREAVAQLKQACRERYAQAMAREEQAALDEVAARGHRRRRAEAGGSRCP